LGGVGQCEFKYYVRMRLEKEGPSPGKSKQENPSPRNTNEGRPLLKPV